MSEKLPDIIKGLIKRQIPSPKELRGGLLLSYKDADPGMPLNRLLCYRNGRRPSVTEMRTMVRDLKTVVPEVDITESDYWTWQSDKGLIYGCYTLSWPPVDGLVQRTLFAE